MAVDVQVGFTDRGHRAVVRCSGVLDSRAVTDLRRRLVETLDAAPDEVVLDLHGCDFANAGGPALLVWLVRRAQARDVQVELVGLAADDEALLHRLGLLEVLAPHVVS